MGFLKPEVEGHQPKSQATGLSEGLLGLLQGMLTRGEMGEPLGPGQAAAAGGVQDFISARETPDQFLELMGPLRESFNRQTDRAAAQTRESFGQLGSRFSSSLGREEGRMRGERATSLDALISQMFLQEQGNLLQALGQQQQFGQEALAPFFDFGRMGILPEQTMVSDAPFVTGASIITDLMKAIGSIKNPTG